MSKIKLVDISKENWEKVYDLKPGKEGATFVAPNAYSLSQAIYENGWVVKAIYDDETLIGFTMYGFAEDLDIYELCRFMIDEKYQNKGYGRVALQIILDEIKEQFHCKEIYLTTSPKNERGKHLYQSFGFVPTGKTCGSGEYIEDFYCLKCE